MQFQTVLKGELARRWRQVGEWRDESPFAILSAQAARQHPTEAARNRFHPFGGALLALLNGLVDRHHEQVLQIGGPIRGAGVQGFWLDGD